jgi:hypothetical protein
MSRFVSYNLLSSALSRPASFPAANPRHLDSTFRFESICLKLKAILDDVDESTIFGLQEVSIKWVGPLRAFFEARAYSLVHTCYGNRFDGYMGVAIAYPTAQTQVTTLSIVCPPQKYGHAGFERWKHEQQVMEAVWYRKLARLGKESLPFRPFIDQLQAPPNPAPQTRITTRFNRAVFAHAKLPQLGDVAVCTYHMPCLFKYPEVMAVHALLFFHALHVYCVRRELDQYIVMMDGNFEPGSLPFNVLQGRCTAEELATIDEVSPGITTLSCTTRGGKHQTLFEFLSSLRHTYPATSITTHTHGHTGEFVGKIDYIWYKLSSGYLEPDTAVTPIQSTANQHSLLPNAAEPSDHYMLSAIFVPPKDV